MATLYTTHLNQSIISVTSNGTATGQIGIAATDLGKVEVGAHCSVSNNAGAVVSGIVHSITTTGILTIQTNRETAAPGIIQGPVYTNADLSAFTVAALSTVTINDQDIAVPWIPVKLLNSDGSSVPSPGGSSSVPATSTSVGPANASVTSVVSTVLTSNTSRKGAAIANTGSVTCYVALGSNATTSIYTVSLVAGAYYEVPFGFTGSITALTAASTTTLSVTEFS